MNSHNKTNSRTLEYRYAVLLLMLAGAFVRLYGLGEWDYYHDEIWHVYVAKQPTLAGVFYTNLVEDGHPILGYFLWHWLLNIWDDPWMARLPSLVAGVLCIPAAYVAGKEMFDSRNGGLFSAFFMTFSCLMIVQSNVVRSYTLMMLFALIALWSVYRYRKHPHPGYILLYFISAAAGFLSEFAIAPVIAFTALHLLYSIYKNDNKRLVHFTLWTFVHVALLAYLLAFTYTLRNVGGVNFSESHFFFERQTKPILLTLANIIFYWVDYINYANFFWFIGGAAASEALIVIVFLVFFSLTMIGILDIVKERKLWTLLFVVTVTAVTVGFYWLALVPLSSPRRNMSMTLCFMVLFYHGLRSCIHYSKKKSGVHKDRAVAATLLLTGLLSVAYVVIGTSWRYLISTEFQQTREQTREAFSFLETHVSKNDIIVTDVSSYYHFNRQNPVTNVTTLSNILAYSNNYDVPVFIVRNDLRMKSFILNPLEIQKAIYDLVAMGRLDTVENIWFVGIQHINVKTSFLDPGYGRLIRIRLYKGLLPHYGKELENLITEQQTLARKLYDSAVYKKVKYAYDCGYAEDEVEIGTEKDCLVKLVLLAVPRSVVYKQFVDAPRYGDPEAFLGKILMETKGK